MAPNASYLNWQNNTDKSWWKDPGLRRSMVDIGILYLCAFTFGYDGSLLSGLQTMPRWGAYFDYPAGQTLGLISASFYFPKILAGFLASFLAERYGRRLPLLLGSIISVTGAFLNGFAQNLGMFIAGRALLGGGLAIQATLAAPLVAELCHPRLRSVSTATYYCTYHVGATISAWLCFGLLPFDSNYAWRIPCLVQGLGTAIVGIHILLGQMSESPRWLMNNGQKEKAALLLAKMHANGDMQDELVVNQLREIEDSLEKEHNAEFSGYSAFLKTSGNRRRLLIITIVATGTQLSGTGLVSYYLAPILKLSGITKPVQQAGINAGLYMMNLAISTTAAQFVERWGRRPMWLTGTTGILMSFVVVTALSGSFANNKVPAVGIAVIPFLYIFYGFYDMSWSILPYLYVPELLPFHLRTKGLAIYITIQSISVAFNQYVNPIALAAIAWKYYLCYMAVQATYMILAYFFFIETKGYTIEEVSQLLDLKDNATASPPVELEFVEDKPAPMHKEVVDEKETE